MGESATRERASQSPREENKVGGKNKNSRRPWTPTEAPAWADQRSLYQFQCIDSISLRIFSCFTFLCVHRWRKNGRIVQNCQAGERRSERSRMVGGKVSFFFLFTCVKFVSLKSLQEDVNITFRVRSKSEILFFLTWAFGHWDCGASFCSSGHSNGTWIQFSLLNEWRTLRLPFVVNRLPRRHDIIIK